MISTPFKKQFVVGTEPFSLIFTHFHFTILWCVFFTANHTGYFNRKILYLYIYCIFPHSVTAPLCSCGPAFLVVSWGDLEKKSTCAPWEDSIFCQYFFDSWTIASWEIPVVRKTSILGNCDVDVPHTSTINPCSQQTAQQHRASGCTPKHSIDTQETKSEPLGSWRQIWNQQDCLPKALTLEIAGT